MWGCGLLINAEPLFLRNLPGKFPLADYFGGPTPLAMIEGTQLSFPSLLNAASLCELVRPAASHCSF
jgi:hypothetical protein